MLLVAMNNVSLAQFTYKRSCDRIVTLASNIGWIADNMQFKVTCALASRVFSKGQQSCGGALGHMPREFKGVTLRSAINTAFAEKRRDKMHDSQANL
ncbi:MAG: hypothetical protein ABSG46_06670 [Candidatus Binataceae bacterium]